MEPLARCNNEGKNQKLSEAALTFHDSAAHDTLAGEGRVPSGLLDHPTDSVWWAMRRTQSPPIAERRGKGSEIRDTGAGLLRKLTTN